MMTRSPLLTRFVWLILCGSWVVLSGCQPAIVNQLIGNWEADGVEELAQRMTGGKPFESEGLSGLLDSAIELAAEQIDAKMEVEFRSNRELVTRTKFGGDWQIKTGRWKFIEHTDQQVTLWCQLEEDDPVQIKVSFEGPDTLSMVPPNIAVLKKTLTFHRVTQ